MNNEKKAADIKNIESIEKLTDAIGFVDDGMISEYDEMYSAYDKKHEKQKAKGLHLRLLYRVAPLAACFILIIGGVIFALDGLGGHYTPDSNDGMPEGIHRNDGEVGTNDKSGGKYDELSTPDAEVMEPVEDGNYDNSPESFPKLEELLKLSDDEIKAVIKSNSTYYKTYIDHWNRYITKNSSNNCNFAVDNGSNITFIWDESGNIDDIIIDRGTSDS